MNTPTPRTDAAIDDSPYYQSRFVMVPAELAKELERELAAVTAENTRAVSEASNVVAKLASLQGSINDLSHPNCRELLWQINKLKEIGLGKDAKIVALRDALQQIYLGDIFDVTMREIAKESLSTPAPPVVPLADVKPLLTAIENTRHWHDTSYNPATNQTEGVIVSANSFWSLKEALAAFTAKYPAPLSSPSA